MNDDIKLVSIEIQNFRQYYGNQKINFSSREDGFTVIFGKNGEGKSNLLNAINWCLYKFDPHGIGDDMTQDQREKAQEVVVPVILTRIATMAAFVFRKTL